MKKIFKISFLFLAVFGFGNLVFALTTNITQINFTSTLQSINIGTPSAILTTQTQNAGGDISGEKLDTSGTILDFSSSSTTGQFSDANATSCTGSFSTAGASFTLGMDKGSANKHFCYQDSTPGTYTLTVTVSVDGVPTGWTPATQTITITAVTPTLSSIAITTPATKLNYTVGDALDITGLVVTGTYSDSSTKTETITTGNISGFVSSAPANNQILTITDGTRTTTYTVNVNSVIVHLDIKTEVDVPTSCSATDTDGVVHNYPKGDSYLAICALETAIKNSSISNVKFSNQFPSMGLFITSMGDVTADSSSQYWAIYQNGLFANSGITLLPVFTGDVILFQLNDFSDNNLGDQVSLNIHSIVNDAPPSGGGSSGGGSIILPSTFNIQNALAYLKSIQSPDGSFGGSLLYTDWTAIAFGALNVTDSSKDKLLSYFSSHNTISSLLTDNERHAIALLSLGQNPYSFNDVNYIKAITDNFDGTQFGDVNLINDDIFALIPLKNSGYIVSDDIIIKDIAFIISKQKTDGSWEESVDITAATIQTLKSFDSITGVTESLSKATNYLTSKQNNDGGFGDSASSIYSTSWVMQAMSALSASWTKSGHTPIDYLALEQMTAIDGAVLPSSETLQNRIWATSYAIAGANLKPWNAIMQNFPKPTIQNENNLNTTLVNKETNTVNINIPIANKNTNNKSDNKKVASIPEAKKSIAVVSQELPASPNTPEIIPDTLTATAVSPVSNQINSNIIAFVLGVFSGVIPLYFLKKFLIKKN